MKDKFTFSLLLLGGIAIWFFFWWFFTAILGNDVARGGPFDALNSFFSALAFFVLIYTVNLQRQELELQRQELAETKEEFIQQNQTLRKQRFENTFFNMITLHHNIVEKINIPVGRSDLISRKAIKKVYENFKETYLMNVKKNGNPPIRISTVDDHKHLVINSFTENYLPNDEYLRHYFSNFITLVKFARFSNLILENERDQYFDIITSQLNSDEIALLFYYFHAGYAMNDKDLFNDLRLGGMLNAGLLADVSHTYLFDPQYVIDRVLSDGKEFFVTG